MPWKEATAMSQREEFVVKALGEDANMSELCRAYGISRKTGYKWLNRYLTEGRDGLGDRSRRPRHSPEQTPQEIEQAILDGRKEHPVWGGRKLKRWLENRGHTGLPAPSTITAILRRHGQLDPKESAKHQPFTRFEKARPNELWQMDFKGHFQVGNGERCHPLTVLDDHSRFLIGLQACANETRHTVQEHLTAFFRAYGLPERMLMDNGSPWGDNNTYTPYTVLTVWMLRLSIRVSHSRPYHPQTLGKDERLHRTLQAELLNRTTFHTLPDCQPDFDRWRDVYNLERPHEALDLNPPMIRYHPSERPFPEVLPPVIYPDGCATRKVDLNGRISFQGRLLRVGRAFRGQTVGLQHDLLEDGLVHVFFNNFHVRTLDLR
jgi:transposase InsO family protein